MEIELKYAIDDEASAEKIFLDPYIEMIKDQQTEEDVRMQAVYFDTEDRRLNAAGIAFRVRRENEMLQATLKWSGNAEGGMHRREEINVFVADEAQLQEPDLSVFAQSEMGDVLRETVGDRKLIPLMDVQFVRHQVRVDTGKSISELSVDKGSVTSCGKTAPILEMEIELYSGEEEDMVALGELLAEKYGLRPENTSKFKKGLDLIEENA